MAARVLRVKCALTAMAMAMDDSVTVSMGDEMRGVFSVIFLVNADVRSYRNEKEKPECDQYVCERERERGWEGILTTSSDMKSMKPGRIRKSLLGEAEKNP